MATYRLRDRYRKEPDRVFEAVDDAAALAKCRLYAIGSDYALRSGDRCIALIPQHGPALLVAGDLAPGPERSRRGLTTYRLRLRNGVVDYFDATNDADALALCRGYRPGCEWELSCGDRPVAIARLLHQPLDRMRLAG